MWRKAFATGEIDHQRRHLLGVGALTLAAMQFGMDKPDKNQMQVESQKQKKQTNRTLGLPPKQGLSRQTGH